jgi:aminopeptidase-like protein
VKKQTLSDLLAEWDAAKEGAELYAIISALYPICRSITGNGLRQSLRLLQRTVSLELHEVPSGTEVFDWTVPNEWNIQDAYIKNAVGHRVVDFRKSNLHVLNYSVPVHQTMSLTELRPHLFTLPDAPEWIPYRTSYYQETWGFCMSQRELERMEEGQYEVCIDSTVQPGHLTYGEHRVDGLTEGEVLISCHSCHPSLCNDNLSGMAMGARLARLLEDTPLHYSYRFVWIPGTIGSITWLARNEADLHRIRHGFVLSCVGDPGPFTYKRSRRGDAEVDRAFAHVLRHHASKFELRDFTPYGYDERQYCSPGINLPVGCFMRTPNGSFPEYHTSADDLTLVTPGALAESLRQLVRVVQLLEQNRHYVNLNPKGEPQLGRRGLYRQVGGLKDAPALQMAMLWVLNLSDGEHDLLEVAERGGMDFLTVSRAADLLTAHGLLRQGQSQKRSPAGGDAEGLTT